MSAYERGGFGERGCAGGVNADSEGASEQARVLLRSQASVNVEPFVRLPPAKRLYLGARGTRGEQRCCEPDAAGVPRVVLGYRLWEVAEQETVEETVKREGGGRGNGP